MHADTPPVPGSTEGSTAITQAGRSCARDGLNNELVVARAGHEYRRALVRFAPKAWFDRLTTNGILWVRCSLSIAQKLR